jgi:hypothetical protein
VGVIYEKPEVLYDRTPTYGTDEIPTSESDMPGFKKFASC